MGQKLLVARNDYEQLLMDLHKLEDDAEKFYHQGNAAAGTRLRNGLLQCGKDITAARKTVLEIKTKRKEKAI